jgi:Bacterial regulatory proteins, tetR family
MAPILTFHALAIFRSGAQSLPADAGLRDLVAGLFAERTYAGVSIEEVGAALGIAGASVYNHFPSKSGILITALARGKRGCNQRCSSAKECGNGLFGVGQHLGGPAR